MSETYKLFDAAGKVHKLPIPRYQVGRDPNPFYDGKERQVAYFVQPPAGSPHPGHSGYLARGTASVALANCVWRSRSDFPGRELHLVCDKPQADLCWGSAPWIVLLDGVVVSVASEYEVTFKYPGEEEVRTGCAWAFTEEAGLLEVEKYLGSDAEVLSVRKSV